MHLKLKSREILFAHNSLLSWQIVLKFCTEHGSNTAVLCANFENDLSTYINTVDKQDFARFEF